MNQDKTGKFISKLRKEKKLTQADLAEKMGVSINAVSKWERGLSFPDVSLYKSLCNELGISIEELINGEKGNSEEAKEQAIYKTIDEKDKSKKKSNKIIIILSIIITIFIVFGLLYYNIVLKVNLDTHSDYLYEVAINYLKEEELEYNPDSKNKDFNSFYAYQDTKTPFVVSIFAIGFTILLSVLFYLMSWGVDGLGLAQSIGAVVEIIILLYILQRRAKRELLDKAFWRAMGRMLFAGVITGCVAFSMTKFVPLMASDTSLVITIPKFLIIAGVSFVAYLIASYFLNLKEAAPILRYFKKILFRNVK